MSRTRIAVALVTCAVAASGCGSPALSADSTCEEYLAAPSDVRHDVAVRVSAQIDGVSSPGNPMWGLSADAACGSDPTMTLRELFSR